MGGGGGWRGETGGPRGGEPGFRTVQDVSCGPRGTPDIDALSFSPLPLPSRGHLQGSTHTHRLGNRRIGPMIPPRGQQGPVGSFRARRPCTGTAARVTLSDFPSNVEVSQEVKLFSSQLLHVCYRSHPLHRRPLCGVCVFYYCRTYDKAVRLGGGGEWRTCAMRDDEPRPVWMSLLITR